MKSNLVKNILDGVLCTCLVFAVFFFVRFYFTTKQLRAEQPLHQAELAKYQQSHQVLNSLLAETAEYSRTHPDPALTRILDSLKAPPPAAGGAQKPPGR
jgi:hypothetical protein